MTGEERSPGIIDFSPDGRHIMATFGKALKIWEVASGQLIRKLRGYGPIFSSDGSVMATRQGDTAWLYDWASGRLLQTFKTPGESIEVLVFSNDASWIAAGTGRGNIEVWDVKTGNSRLSYSPQDGRANALRFSTDRATLTAVTGGAVYYYDTRDGNELQRFRNNFGMRTPAITPDGSGVVVIDGLGRILFFCNRCQDLLEVARKRMPVIGSTQ